MYASSSSRFYLSNYFFSLPAWLFLPFFSTSTPISFISLLFILIFCLFFFIFSILVRYLPDNLTDSPPLTLYFNGICGRDKIKSSMMSLCFILRCLPETRPCYWVSYFSRLFSYSFAHSALSSTWDLCFRVQMMLA